MKKILLFPSMSVLIMLVGCASDSQYSYRDPDSPGSGQAGQNEEYFYGHRIPPTPTSSLMRETVSSDAEIVGLLVAINENEIAAAQAAEKKHLDAKVQEYAETLRKEHRANLDKTLALGDKIDAAPATSSASSAVRRMGSEEQAKLTNLSGQQYSDAFVNAMVQGHTDALALIDQQLLPQAKSEELKDHLTETRSHIAGHLATARELQSTEAMGAPGSGSRRTVGGRQSKPDNTPIVIPPRFNP